MTTRPKTFTIVHLLLAAVFLVFALLQFNDPDPLRWVLVYTSIAASCVLAAFGRFPKGWLWGVTLLIGGWMLIRSPAIVHWAQQGFPNITGAMQAETPIIEGIRELLGLVIGFAMMLSLALRRK